MKALKFIKSALDRLLVFISLSALLAMIVIIIYQVFSRQLFKVTPSWAEELSMLLFVWTSFLGVAYGFKQKLHIGVSFLVDAFPEKLQTACDLFAKVLIIGFGVVLIYYGWNFTVLMGGSTMAGTGLPSSVLYAVLPITGFYILMYGIELLFVKGLHQEYNDEIDTDAIDAIEEGEA
ncbi:TRAP transporter small permease [Sporosarcina jiandibaonis]|uniref:TRAP transporter small permease n=1 Tax=Sporosarcina jiandibaonis TaxID=2715535 RepID=UPI001553AE50|nr:TRAP transporter small permease [Sporosarcina jiandibaonis]